MWNTEEEIFSREDHPYRYGYGALCHSGYHYIDILSGLPGSPVWGETDFVSARAARRRGSGDTVCLFQFDPLQTTVSLRNWRLISPSEAEPDIVEKQQGERF